MEIYILISSLVILFSGYIIYLQHREMHLDDLTGVFNQKKLRKDLKKSMGKKHVLFFDLDNLKEINDTHGHLVGSDVIKNFGKYLNKSLGKLGKVYRYGGDEFVFISYKITSKQAKDLAHKVIGQSGIPVSIGIANDPNGEIDTIQLVKIADSTMYEAKKSGKQTVKIVDEL